MGVQENRVVVRRFIEKPRRRIIVSRQCRYFLAARFRLRNPLGRDFLMRLHETKLPHDSPRN